MSSLFLHNSLPDKNRSPSFWQQLDKIARHMLPTLFALLTIIFLSSPLPIPGSTELLSATIINTVFFWSLWRPSGMPVLNVFLIGIFMDLTGSAPLGINTLTLLLMYGVVDYYRFYLIRFRFVIIWCIISLIGLSIAIMQWLLTCLLRFYIFNPIPILFEASLCTGIYPLFSTVCSQILYFFDKNYETLD
ncbi:MAG: rod shape-determining protein MreD [Acetobacter sp.]|nr:rod shape-determining protein MreD [Acetobacter sp.]